MTNQEILTKAVEKAITNGWNSFYDEFVGVTDHGCDRVTIYFKERNMRYKSLIFDHGFARALWGDKISPWLSDQQIETRTNGLLLKGWQFHLQRMVIDDDPIAYLGRNI